MGDYPNNFRMRDLNVDLEAIEACLGEANLLLESMSCTSIKLAAIVQEMSKYVQHSSQEYPIACISKAQDQIQRALESVQEAQTVVEKQRRDAKQMTVNVVYGLPPT